MEPGIDEPIYLVERKHVFTKSRPMSDTEMSVIASDGHVLISQVRIVKSIGFRTEEMRIRLPTSMDIAIGNVPNVEDESIYAIDVRGGRRSEFRPVQEPGSPEIQQGFTSVLKDALREILAGLT
jgi:hypothetical protein